MNAENYDKIRDVFIDRIDSDNFNLKYIRSGCGNLSQERVELIRWLDELTDCLMRSPAHMIVQRAKDSDLFRIRFGVGKECVRSE